MEIEQKLDALGLKLPKPPEPPPHITPWRVPHVQLANIIFLGGNIGSINGHVQHRGKVGDTVSVAQGYEMARNCGLNHLAILKAALGDLDRVERIVRLAGYINVVPGFTDMAKVLNGESDLLLELWGDNGQHARISVGMASMPEDVPLEADLIVQIRV